MPARAVWKTARPILWACLGLATCLWAAARLPSPHDVLVSGIVLGAALLGALWVLDMVAPGVNVFSWAITRVRAPASSYVVLTFDDGPIEPTTREVLDILKRHGVRATFFCIGENARKHPELMDRMAREGHDVANHSDSHLLLPLQSTATIRAQIERAADSLTELTGQRPRWLRCPKGYKSARVARVARGLGQQLIGFSYPAYDVENPPAEELVERVVARASAGDILLLHDGHAPHKPGRRESVVAALPGILEGLSAKGLTPLSLGQAVDRDPGLAAALAARAPSAPKATPRSSEVMRSAMRDDS